MDKAENHEAVSIYYLDPEDRDALLLEQKECVLNWCTQDEWPMGVIHSYIYRNGKIWITARRPSPPRLRATQKPKDLGRYYLQGYFHGRWKVDHDKRPVRDS